MVAVAAASGSGPFRRRVCMVWPENLPRPGGVSATGSSGAGGYVRDPRQGAPVIDMSAAGDGRHGVVLLASPRCCFAKGTGACSCSFFHPVRDYY
jgi:hypothetical protein